MLTSGPSIYLVNPKADPQNYFGAEVYAESGLAPAQLIADLTITTVAALFPDDFTIRLCDEQLTPVDLDLPADFIGLTGKVSQARRLIFLADEFRRQGRVVIIGGPFASLDPEAVRPHCDILVRGELETVGESLFADLRANRWKAEYFGGPADMSTTPIPRWDLYPNGRALMGSVQTSRGCPFDCEFCDVPAYVGRKQRHKSPNQVLAELDVLYRLGYRSVFLADDNFSANRRRAKALLVALAEWNARQVGGTVSFSTQMSIDAAKDDELLRLAAEAGMDTVFIGIETPNQDSLIEARKPQNVGIDLVEQIGRFLDHGIWLIGGMIVGFDADNSSIFERQRRFAEAAPVPVFSLGALVAPAATRLADRLSREGRLIAGADRSTAVPWDTNIVPKQMSHVELLRGVRWLGNRLYQPESFGDRVMHALKRFKPNRSPASSVAGFGSTDWQPLARDTAQVIQRLNRLGRGERALVGRLGRYALNERPETLRFVRTWLRFYAQVRCVYALTGFWNSGDSA